MTINWFTITYAAYWVLLLYVTVQIIHQYTISSRASAWLFTIYVFPVVGMGLYFIFGFKRLKRRIYQEKLNSDQKALERYLQQFRDESWAVIEKKQASFNRDCLQARQLHAQDWESRSALKVFIEKLARLISPIM